MANLFAAYSGMGASLVAMMAWVIPVLLIIVILIAVLFITRQRSIYRYPVTIFREREAGGIKERETKGGIIERKNSAPFFAIKMGMFKRKEIYKLPDLSGMTHNDRLYYYQKNPDSYIQLKRKLTAEVIQFEPVESDVKYGGILAMQRIDQITNTQSFWEKYTTPIMILSALSIIMIMFYMLLEKVDPNMMLKISENLKTASEALAVAKQVG